MSCRNPRIRLVNIDARLYWSRSNAQLVDSDP